MIAMDLLFEALEEMGMTYFRQGSWRDEDGDYPDSFFTFWNVRSGLLAHYDNKNRAKEYEIQVCYYTNDFGSLYTKFEELLQKLESKGFVLQDDGYDIPSDVDTHIGRVTNVLYRL